MQCGHKYGEIDRRENVAHFDEIRRFLRRSSLLSNCPLSGNFLESLVTWGISAQIGPLGGLLKVCSFRPQKVPKSGAQGIYFPPTVIFLLPTKSFFNFTLRNQLFHFTFVFPCNRAGFARKYYREERSPRG
jgi:hypothetical protein